MDDAIRAVVDAEWAGRLGVDQSVLRSGGVHVVSSDLGANDAMSFLLDGTCIVVVPQHEIVEARLTLNGLGPQEAFTAEILELLVGADAQVDGPSCHNYVNRRSFLGGLDSATICVSGDEPALVRFLARSDSGDLAESGLAIDRDAANATTSPYWILREDARVVAASNMTAWRGLPADVGVITDPRRRGRGLARRVVGSMVAESLRSVGIVRYRALASNVASLSVARRLGFEQYGQNYRARRLLA